MCTLNQAVHRIIKDNFLPIKIRYDFFSGINSSMSEWFYRLCLYLQILDINPVMWSLFQTSTHTHWRRWGNITAHTNSIMYPLMISSPSSLRFLHGQNITQATKSSLLPSHPPLIPILPLLLPPLPLLPCKVFHPSSPAPSPVYPREPLGEYNLPPATPSLNGKRISSQRTETMCMSYCW